MRKTAQQKQHSDISNDAGIGLAGRIYGLGAALLAIALWQVTGWEIFSAIAGVGAWINLFNLLPFGSLDGGRGFQAISSKNRGNDLRCYCVVLQSRRPWL